MFDDEINEILFGEKPVKKKALEREEVEIEGEDDSSPLFVLR